MIIIGIILIIIFIRNLVPQNNKINENMKNERNVLNKERFLLGEMLVFMIMFSFKERLHSLLRKQWSLDVP